MSPVERSYNWGQKLDTSQLRDKIPKQNSKKIALICFFIYDCCMEDGQQQNQQTSQEQALSLQAKSKNTLKILAISVALLISFLFVCVGIGYLYIESRIKKPLVAVSQSQRVFVILQGEGPKTIARKLKEANLISSEFLFVFDVWERGVSQSLQAGRYLLDSSMSVMEIVDAIVFGKVSRDEISVTIPEGFMLKEIETRAGVKLANFTIADFKNKYDFLADAPASADLEGYLFPDTYFLKKESLAVEMAEKMLANFGDKLSADLRAEIARQGKSIHEIVIMASIIEKEVRTEEDMKIVSGVLWKRLDIGMPLQADATVVYGVGRNELTVDDLKIDSPYNTYTRKGLPKGPISNPGLRAILAAIYSTPSDYLYYLSKPTGETVLSKTLEEHNAAKNKYLRNN